jgi:hypothetical protein
MFTQEDRLNTSLAILGFMIANKKYDGVMIEDVVCEAVGYTDSLLKALSKSNPTNNKSN